MDAPPYNGISVPLDAGVGVTFSEPMNTTSVTFRIEPDVAGQSLAWTEADARLTVNHTAPFVACQVYRVTVTGTDADEGLPLIPNPHEPQVVSPWRFIAACANPFIYMTRPEANATDVPIDQEIYVFMPSGISPETVTWTVTGGPFRNGTVSWDVVFGGVYVGLHVTHGGWRQCTRYTILIEGTLGGLPLVEGFALDDLIPRKHLGKARWAQFVKHRSERIEDLLAVELGEPVTTAAEPAPKLDVIARILRPSVPI